MKFGRAPLDSASGQLLGHNVFCAGTRVLGKGTRLGLEEIARLRAAGIADVYVARIDPNDVLEDAAAARIAQALVASAEGTLLRHGSSAGRVTLKSRQKGVLQVEPRRLLALNRVSGVTLAVRAPYTAVDAGCAVATLKIIPFALPEAVVSEAESIAASGIARVDALRPRRTVLIGFGAADRKMRLFDAFVPSMRQRLARLGTHELESEYVPIEHDPERALAAALQRHAARGCELAILVGETATMDEDDLVPAALRQAGGEIGAIGAPVFPGNLLVIGYLGRCAILGAPGCARQPSLNVVDLVLPRLLSDERLGRDQIAALGLGGLITSNRPGGDDP